MKDPRQSFDSPYNSKGRIIGAVATVAIHLSLLFVFFSSSLEQQIPQPFENSIVIDFEEEKPIERPVKAEAGVRPKATNAEPTKEEKLVQKSESTVKAETVNTSDETTMGNEGEVEMPEPPRKKEINKRALFSSERHRRDTTAVQTAKEADDRLTAGHYEGNTQDGNPDGMPSAKLKGRSVMGSLPLPEYTVEQSGTVVVEITVDQYGKVLTAIPGVKGTTVQEKRMWEAAKEAALKARFNISSTAPTSQKGTITYIFNLK